MICLFVMFVVVMEILLFIWCGWEFKVFKDLLDVLGVVVWLNKIKNLKKEEREISEGFIICCNENISI